MKCAVCEELNPLITRHLTSQNINLDAIQRILVVSDVPQELYENGIQLLATMRQMNTTLNNIVSIGVHAPMEPDKNQQDMFRKEQE